MIQKAAEEEGGNKEIWFIDACCVGYYEVRIPSFLVDFFE